MVYPPYGLNLIILNVKLYLSQNLKFNEVRSNIFQCILNHKEFIVFFKIKNEK